ncbi:hypothetical protein RHGRI_029472 [Rhododendron griersonianum]|uniref:PNPLA domain-containing protein n=1 Tax=Rhododendron griersonianum TaxID=479676 RepID=A0AAV6ILS3_9ERIC|nr:hypothetical protein RHGRI_029472 [Rhododendron griersonianum]
MCRSMVYALIVKHIAIVLSAGGPNTPSNIDPWSIIGDESSLVVSTDRPSCFDRNNVALRMDVLCDRGDTNVCLDGGVGVNNPGFWGMEISSDFMMLLDMPIQTSNLSPTVMALLNNWITLPISMIIIFTVMQTQSFLWLINSITHHVVVQRCFCEYVVTGKDAGTGSLLAVLAEAGFRIGLKGTGSLLVAKQFAQSDRPPYPPHSNKFDKKMAWIPLGPGAL